jgi:hypothetical protein
MPVIYKVAVENRLFTTDEVWFELKLAQVESPREHRAMGAAMAKAVRLRWIAWTAGTRESERKECHRNPKRIWLSWLWIDRHDGRLW